MPTIRQITAAVMGMRRMRETSYPLKIDTSPTEM